MGNSVESVSVKYFGLIAAGSGFFAVALGAFGSHGLKEYVAVADLAIWNTAVQYQMFHTLALLAVVLYAASHANKWLTIAACFLVAGIVIFSGSLYILVLTDTRWLGAITPLGGLAYLIAWLAIFMAFKTQPVQRQDVHK